MGGKKRGKTRQRKRADAAALEIVDANVEAQLETKSDTDLFMIDAVPDANALRPSRKERRLALAASGSTDEQKKKKRRLSEKDQREVKKMLDNIGNDEDKMKSLVEQTKKKKWKAKPTYSGKKVDETFDLWNDDAKSNDKKKTRLVSFTHVGKSLAGTSPMILIPSNDDKLEGPSGKQIKARENAKRTGREKVAVDIATSGQSYLPDEELHQDAIGEALSIELRRKEAIDHLKAPIASGMSEETMAVLVGDDDGNDSSSDEEGDAEDQFRPKKKKEKLTRAQRNKRRRAKLLEVELQERKRVKLLLNSVNDVKSIKKGIVRAEKEKSMKNEVVKKLKDERRAKPEGINLHTTLMDIDPIEAPALPVALTCELEENGRSLRTVKPKGSLMSERLNSLTVRNMANRKQMTKKNVVQGKKRKSGKGREFLLV